jgi:hypothetical protein
MTSTTFESHRWTDEHNDQVRHYGSCSVCAEAHADDPSLPVDVRAARAHHRAGLDDNPTATVLRYAVREAVATDRMHDAGQLLEALLRETTRAQALAALEDATDEAQATLAATDATELLAKAYALTHRIHESERTERYSADVQRTRDLRAQRDLITVEVLRRMGGQA